MKINSLFYGVFTACALALSAGAQINLLNPPATPPAFPTNLLNPPATAPAFPTNLIAQELGLSAVGSFALNLLPGWDRTATNSFAAHELELEVSPTWKTAAASGSTPYLSIGGDYFFTRHFGTGMDLITFGSGNGSSDLDSAHLFAIGRADKGNAAGHLLLGLGRDMNRKAFDFEAGGGLEYRYSTGIGILVDTRYLKFFDTSGGFKLRDDHEFLTRVGITLHF